MMETVLVECCVHVQTLALGAVLSKGRGKLDWRQGDNVKTVNQKQEEGAEGDRGSPAETDRPVGHQMVVFNCRNGCCWSLCSSDIYRVRNTDIENWPVKLMHLSLVHHSRGLNSRAVYKTGQAAHTVYSIFFCHFSLIGNCPLFHLFCFQ